MLPSLAFSLAHRLRGSDSLAEYQRIKSEPFLSPEQVKDKQFVRLRELLAHAENTVPYYRELFKSNGIRSADIRTMADYSQIPVLTKDILRERLNDLLSTAFERSSLTVQHSGGSTGIPVRFYRARQYLDSSDAGTYRNLSQCGWEPGEMVAFFWGFNDRLDAMPTWEFELRQRLRRFYQLDPFKSGPADMAIWSAKWQSIGARAALGYASTIARFAEYLLINKVHVPPLKGVFTTAEKLYPQQRKQIQDAFSCNVFDLYGSSEVQNIASECPHGNMHINSDFCLLESEEPDCSGPQPFIVTSLKQWAMPFIRYRNEDCGELMTGTCDCGRSFPLLKLDVSRVSDNFVLPDGSVIHGEFFTHLMYGSAGIDSFQFHQTAPDRIVLRIVPATHRADQVRATLAGVSARIGQLAAGQIQFDIIEVDSIALSSAGKHRFTRSDVSTPN